MTPGRPSTSAIASLDSRKSEHVALPAKPKREEKKTQPEDKPKHCPSEWLHNRIQWPRREKSTNTKGIKVEKWMNGCRHAYRSKNGKGARFGSMPDPTNENRNASGFLMVFRQPYETRALASRNEISTPDSESGQFVSSITQYRTRWNRGNQGFFLQSDQM
jgi:hypothetical protein